MSDNHQAYYRARALEERSRIRDAASPAVAAIHQELAEKYEALVAKTHLDDEERLDWNAMGRAQRA